MQFLLDNLNSIHAMAMTMLLVFVPLAVRRMGEHPAIRWNLLLLLCLLAYICRVFLADEWFMLSHFFNTLEYFTPFLFMLSIQASFDDDFVMGRVEWGALAVLLVLLSIFLVGRWMGFDETGLPALVHISLQYGLVAFCVFWAYWRTYQTWSNDLMPRRRQARWLFVVVIGPTILAGVILYYLTTLQEDMAPYIDLYVSLSILLSGFSIIWLFGDLSFEHLVGEAKPAPAAAKREAETQLPQYQVEIEALVHAMETDKRYLESALTMAKLSQYTRIPEYKLRVAINKVLGYKNFNSYLNSYRLLDAKARLSDPQNQEPITNISLDCGFLNQSTFNKVFKEDTGLTPSEYRDAARSS